MMQPEITRRPFSRVGNCRYGARRRLTATLLGGLLFLAATPAAAGSGSRASLPAGPKVKNALRVNVDTTWVDANGYRPVQIELIPWPPGPAPATRSIRVELRPHSWRSGHGWCGATTFIEIPQNAASVEAVLSVPQREQWSSFNLQFYEDGERLEDLDYQGAMTFTGNYGWTEASPAMLFIDRDAPPRALRQQTITDLRMVSGKGDSFELPDVRGLVEIHPPPDLQQFGYTPDVRATDLTILDSLSRWSKVEILPPADLPARWIDYTGFDLVFISLGDLRLMARQNAPQWQAIRDWLATGPTLCVYDVGDDFSRLAELEQLLKISPLPANAPGVRYRGWQAPLDKDYTRALTRAQPTYANQYWYSQQQEAQRAVLSDEVKKSLQEREGKPPVKPSFVFRSVELGRVVALAAENPFPGVPQEWGWMLNSIDSGDWMWYRRHGMSLNRRNLDYWNFLIPGVGLAPVNSFLVLISLFVVVIGPINYWFLVRQGRLYLLLVTVPLGAMAVTLSLFGYALVTDGLGVKARLRSYTEIDQRRGRSVSWSRQSYYASMTPSGGLEFPETAAVYPIVVEPNDRPNYYDTKHMVDWEYGQTLAKGYIASRVTSQMIVVQARKSSAKVEIKQSAGAPRATNRLGVELEFFVMRDPQGDFFAAENLADGASAALTPINWGDAAKRLQRALADVRPTNPPGYDPREHNEALDFGNRNYWWGGDVDSALGEPSLASSVLERALRRVTSPDAATIAPQSYIALVPHSPEVPLGVKQARQLQSIHVVVGKW